MIRIQHREVNYACKLPTDFTISPFHFHSNGDYVLSTNNNHNDTLDIISLPFNIAIIAFKKKRMVVMVCTVDGRMLVT